MGKPLTHSHFESVSWNSNTVTPGTYGIGFLPLPNFSSSNGGIGNRQSKANYAEDT